MTTEILNPQSTLPSFVHDPRYQSSYLEGRAPRDWPENPALAIQLHEAESRLSAGDSSVQPFLEAVAENNTLYLNGVTQAVDAEAAKSASGFVSQRLNKGDSSFFIESQGGVQRPSIDLEALGLPGFEADKHDRHTRPLAVVVHGARKTGDVGCIELLVTDGESVQSRYLENISAVEDPNTPQAPRWIMPGTSLTSRRVVNAAVSRTEGKRGKSMLKVTAEKVPYGEVEDGEARIIRPAPVRGEKVVAKPYHERKSGKTLGRVTKAVAGLALVASVSSLFGAEASKNREIKTAHELVLPAGTKMHNGVEQAEQFFKEQDLSRSRKAFEAYFAGDTEALRAQAKALGYESNWMKPEAITAVEQAKSYDELVAAFDKVFDGVPVKLRIFNGEKELAFKGLVTRKYDHEKATNLAKAKEYAVNVTRLFNVMDKEYMLKMEPLDYIVTGKITDSDGVLDPAGYYHNDPNSAQSYIVLADKLPFLGLENAEELVGHETAHYFLT